MQPINLNRNNSHTIIQHADEPKNTFRVKCSWEKSDTVYFVAVSKEIAFLDASFDLSLSPQKRGPTKYSPSDRQAL